MKVLLEGLLPRLLPRLSFLCIAHEGKQDLEKSVPRKLRAWKEPGVSFVVVRDNDGRNCFEVKQGLASLCSEAGRADALVRIACQELEAWYFGEPSALANAYSKPALASLLDKAKYRDPDAIQKPSTELEALVPEFQKVSGARRLREVLSETGNRSRSFNVFLDGVRRVATAMGQADRAEETARVGDGQIDLFKEK